MTLRELLEVTPSNEYITLQIDNKWYPMTSKLIDIIRPEIFDLEVRTILGGLCSGEPSLTITLEVPVDGTSIEPGMFNFIWDRCNEEEQREIKKISGKFDIRLDEAAILYESCNHSYSWTIGRIEEWRKKLEKQED